MSPITFGSRSSVEPTRSVLAVVWVTLLLAFWRELAGTPTIAYVGDFNLTISEVILSTAGFGILASRRMPNLAGLLPKLVLLYVLLYGFSLMRGLGNSPYNAITSMRLNAALPVILVWALFIDPRQLLHPRVQAISITVADMLAVLVVLRVAIGPSFLMIAASGDDFDINDGGRAISAQGSVILASAVAQLMARFLSPGDRRRPSVMDLVHASGLILALILTKQGTATVATGVAVVISFSVADGPYRSLRFAFGGVCAIIGIGLYFASQDADILNQVNGMLPDSLQFDLAHRGETFETRQSVWSNLVTDMDSWSAVSRLMGLPAGVMPHIFAMVGRNWVYWTFSVHSMYYGLLPVVGLLGLSAYIGIIASLLVAALRAALAGPIFFRGAASAALAWVSIIAILGVTYDLRNENAIPLAFALAVALARPTRMARPAGGVHDESGGTPAVRARLRSALRSF